VQQSIEQGSHGSGINSGHCALPDRHFSVVRALPCHLDASDELQFFIESVAAFRFPMLEETTPLGILRCCLTNLIMVRSRVSGQTFQQLGRGRFGNRQAWTDVAISGSFDDEEWHSRCYWFIKCCSRTDTYEPRRPPLLYRHSRLACEHILHIRPA
jgi:hypothetical protein